MKIDIKRMIGRIKSEIEKLKEENEVLCMIVVNYFNDGECIDLGTKIVVCDEDEENFKEKYYSFTIDNPEFEEEVLDFIKQDGIVNDDDNEYQRQQELAIILVETLKRCNWIDKKTIIKIEAYD